MVRWLLEFISAICALLDACLLLGLEYCVLGPTRNLRIRLMIWRIQFYMIVHKISEIDRQKLEYAIDCGEQHLQSQNSFFA